VCAAALAQPRRKPVRIATLDPGRDSEETQLWRVFRKRLEALGYAEGSGYVIEARWGNSEPKRLPGLAAELVALKPDVIVTTNTITALAARQATSSIAIVSIGAAAPVESGLIAAFDRPGGNLTGITPLQGEIAGKWIEAIHEIAPQAKAIVFLAVTENPAAKQVFSQLAAAASSRAMSVEMIDGRDAGTIDLAFNAMAAKRTEALIVGSPAGLLAHRVQIVEAARRQRIPAIYPRGEFAEAGGLMSFATDFRALFSRAADYVHRIAEGARPADLPFERASTFELVVNLRTARELGLKIPQSLHLRATRVIE